MHSTKVDGMYCTMVDGEFADSISVHDRGLAYGDGLFESIRWCEGGLPLLQHHLRRLERGCRILGIEYNEQTIRGDLATMLSRIRRLSPRSQGSGVGLLKLILTRGQGGAGYTPPEAGVASPRLIVLFHFLVNDRDAERSGVALEVCPSRLPSNPILAGIKHLNRLDYVLAAQSLEAPGSAIGLLLSVEGLVVESLHHNIFLVKNGQLMTPSLEQCGVKGVLRSLVLNQLGACLLLKPEESNLRLQDVLDADEVFIGNSVRGIWPVRALGSRRWQAGPVTRVLQQGLQHVWGAKQCV